MCKFFFKLSSRISSDPQHILQLMDDMDSDFSNEDDFDVMVKIMIFRTFIVNIT